MRLQILVSVFLLSCFGCTNISTDTVTPGARIVDISELDTNATRLYLTANPSTNTDVRSLWVSIARVAVHASASAPIDDPDWQDTVLVPQFLEDVQSLYANNNVDVLDQVFAPGTYRQMRLSFDEVGVGLDGPSFPVTLTQNSVAFPLGTGLNIVGGNNYGIMVIFNADSLQRTGNTWTLDPSTSMLEAFRINSDGRTVAVAN